MKTLWRSVRSSRPFEANLKRIALKICNDAFDQTNSQAHIGIAEYELFRIMQAQTFLNGADSVTPSPADLRQGRIHLCRPASARRLKLGDYIWADFRATYAAIPPTGTESRAPEAGCLGSAGSQGSAGYDTRAL